MYVAYVATVAITNLMIGFMLATFLGSPRQILALALRNARSPARESLGHNRAVKAAVGANKTSDAVADSGTASPAHDEAENMPRDGSRFEGTWTEITTAIGDQAMRFETSLSALLSRLEPGHALTADDAHSIAQQALDATTQWLAQAEQVVERLGASLKSVPNGKNIIGQCERIMNEQLAQSETSLSNLSMIDLVANTAELPRFSQELARLVESSAEMRDRLTKIVGVAYQS